VKDFDHNSDLIAKFLAGESSLAEKEELFAWTKESQENKAFFESMEDVWNMTEGAEPSPFEADMGSAWAAIDDATAVQQQPKEWVEMDSPDIFQEHKAADLANGKVVQMRPRKFRWSIAAAVLVLLAAGVWWMGQGANAPTMVAVQTAVGEKKEINLPDGSTVWLNENSKLAYHEDFEKRNVELEGEAFFDVERNEASPFKIQSGDATTTVLGTSFNVRAYPQEAKVEVTVETGVVELAVADKAKNTVKETVRLPKGTSGVVYKKEKKVEKVEEKISNANSWQTLRLEFDEDSMKDVISILERHFGTNIEVSNSLIFECPYTSSFDQPNLDEILMVIGASVGFEVEKKGNIYELVGEGCKPNN
jgi:ferric-dicitrate binding protein FerR (iron transport regulator)